MSLSKVKLGELCTVVRGSSPRPQGDPRYYGGSIPRLMVSDVTRDGKLVTPKIDFLTEEGAQKSRPMLAGDFVIAVSGQPGQPLILAVDSCIHDGFVGLRNLDSMRINKDYLFHFMNFTKAKFSATAVGAIFKNLNTHQIKELEIPLPPLPEQKRIAAILDKADAIRRKRQQAIKLADDFLRSVFLDMYESGLDDFKEYSFIDLALKERNSFVNGPFGSNLLTSELTEKGVPVVYIRDIRDRVYRRRSPSHVTIEKAEQLNSCFVFPDDVLIAKVGDPPGTAAIYPIDEPKAIVTQDVIRIRCNQEIVLPTFLVALFNSHHGSKLVNRIKVEATRARIGLGDLKKEKIKIPPLVIQTKFHDIYLKLNSYISSQNKANSLCEEGFSSLSQKAFKGEL